MKWYHSLCMSFLLIFIATTIARNNRNKNINLATVAEKEYVILFELMDVLFRGNTIGFSQEIGYGNLASYTITHFKNPGYRFMDMLDAMSARDKNQKPRITITLNKRVLPRSFVELQEGKKKSHETKTEMMESINYLDSTNYFSSDKEKKLMRRIMDVVLNPNTTTKLVEPIKSTVQLVRKLKSAGYSVYIFANAPDELHEALQKKYSDILNLFDGIILSSHIKIAKPDINSFHQAISAHNLNPSKCIIIDNLAENITAAQEVGMKGILFDKVPRVTKELQKHGVRL